MTTTTNFATVRQAVTVVSYLTHTLGISSCFGHMAADVADEERYPSSIAGAVRYQAGLSRVYERYIAPLYHLARHIPARREAGHGWVIRLSDGREVGPWRTHRGAAWVRTHRRLDGEIVRPRESAADYRARAEASIRRYLAIESAWREAQDALDSCAGVSDEYQLRGRRWFDSPEQDKRLAAALATIQE